MPTKQIGVISVDAGICWIGDPCYILHKDKNPEDIGNSWEEFCDILGKKETKDNRGCLQFNHYGSPGLGVVVPTGYGDGTYPVFATFDRNGTVVSVEVRFDSDDKEYNDE